MDEIVSMRKESGPASCPEQSTPQDFAENAEYEDMVAVSRGQRALKQQLKQQHEQQDQKLLALNRRFSGKGTAFFRQWIALRAVRPIRPFFPC